MSYKGEIDAFVNNIFKKEAQPMNSIDIDLDVDPQDGDTIELHLFKQLIDIMCKGIKILFQTTTKINLSNITTEQFSTLNQYFHSFGWEIILETTMMNQIQKFRISMKHLKSNKILPECIYITSQ